MDKWEYQIVQFDSMSVHTESLLNRLGKNGWELIAVIHDNVGINHFVFKKKMTTDDK